ncbi:glycoside hydrolase family 61 protein [Tricharina praecox]|uniref:glycoside hydrolase family 61 protein n=1 Tax=Tricharina praecox TaxID=43433 RepID=UPI0022209AEE|nr:glycoside hydrolase family 61 protein [Tricharina praecox]KAI5858329.1 glycoside hydrolase family 61 protein [Tricharina praecox]
MQFTLATLLSVLAATATAHTTVYSVYVNGVDQGDGRNTYIRSPPNNNPVKDVTSSSIRCNVNNRVVPNWVSAKAGDTLTFEWYHDARGDEIIASSHKGPVMVYIGTEDGSAWTKIAAEGLSGGVWAVDKLIANKGKHTATIPSSLKPGNYLFRAEIIGLHEAETNYNTNSARGAQFYPSCSQITITSGGSTSPPGGNTFPGTYTATDPGILFNLYSNPTSYPIPGGAVWSG